MKLYGERYNPSQEFRDLAKVLRFASYKRARRIYEAVLDPSHYDANDIAFLACNDRYFLLTCILRRPDAFHPWLYARCREVEAAPDGYLDLWSRYHYKAVQIGEPVQTLAGWKAHGDIVPGDYVFGPDGAPTKVLAKTPVFTDADCFRVTLSDGYSVVVSGDHLWSVDVLFKPRLDDGARGKRLTKVVSTRGLAAEIERAEGRVGRFYPTIPLPLAVQFPEAVLPLDPYVLGVWLGDGTTGHPNVTAGLEDADAMEAALTAAGVKVRRRSHSNAVTLVLGTGKRGNRYSSDIADALRSLSIYKAKAIPEIYMRASVAQRWALFQGLMDTDGSVHIKHGQAIFCAADPALAQQVLDLALSLGINATLAERSGLYKGERRPFWQVQFATRPDCVPFRLPRKAARCVAKKYSKASRRVMSVEPVETQPVSCIQVERPDGLYLIGRRYVTTHNSSIGTFAGVMQEIIRDPNITVAIFSITKNVAAIHGNLIKRECEENELLRSIFPDVFWADPTEDAPSWSADGGLIVQRSANPKEPTVSWYGLLDALPTGAHFALRVYDDVITERVTTQTDTEQIKKITIRWELSQNLATLESKRMWHFGTRYTYSDTYGDLLHRHILRERLYPATHNGKLDGKPVLMTEASWAHVKLTQRSTVAAQMLQNPLAGSENTFDPQHLRAYGLRPRRMNVYILGDPSAGRSRKSDRTAFIVLGMDANRNLYLLDGFVHRMRLTERTENLFALHRKWASAPGVQHVRVGYERYGMQTDEEHFEQEMRRQNYHMDIVEVAWISEGDQSKTKRIGRLEPWFRNSKLWLPPKVWQPNDGVCHWSVNPETNRVQYHPMETEELRARADEIRVHPELSAVQKAELIAKMTENRLDKQARQAGEPYRIMSPIRRLNEDREPYDVLQVIFEEAILHPFSPHDDALDAMSRIMDVDAEPPFAAEALRELEPMAID